MIRLPQSCPYLDRKSSECLQKESLGRPCCNDCSIFEAMQRCSRRSALKRIALFLLLLPLMFFLKNIYVYTYTQANLFCLVTLVCRGRTTSINHPKCGSRKGVKHDLDVPTLTGGVKTKCLRVSLPRQGAACFMILAFCFCFPLFTCNCPCVASRR